METFLRRNFKVKGNISCIYKPFETSLKALVEGIEVKLWHKAPMEKISLGTGMTDAAGDFIIEFEVDSPVDYIVDGTIDNTFIEAYYNGELLKEQNSLLDNLTAYWKLDELSGTLAADATLHNHTGTLSGTTLPDWNAGKINNGLTFYGGLDGTGSSYLSVPTSSDFDFGTGDFTYAFWMKSNNTSGYYCPIDTGYGFADGLLIEFIVPNAINIYIGSSVVYTKTVTVTTDTWYFVVVRRRDGQLELFINGSGFGPSTISLAVACPGTELSIGKYSTAENLDGMLDEIGIWKGYGLSDGEINFLYNDGAGRQYPF